MRHLQYWRLTVRIWSLATSSPGALLKGNSWKGNRLGLWTFVILLQNMFGLSVDFGSRGSKVAVRLALSKLVKQIPLNRASKVPRNRLGLSTFVVLLQNMVDLQVHFGSRGSKVAVRLALSKLVKQIPLNRASKVPLNRLGLSTFVVLLQNMVGLSVDFGSRGSKVAVRLALAKLVNHALINYQ